MTIAFSSLSSRLGLTPVEAARRAIVVLALLGQLLFGFGVHGHKASQIEARDPGLAASIALFGAEGLCLSDETQEAVDEKNGACPCCENACGCAGIAAPGGRWQIALARAWDARRRAPPSRALDVAVAARPVSDIAARGPPGRA